MKTIKELASEAGWWTLSTILRVRLERFRDLVLEDAARVCEEHQGSAETCAEAIRLTKTNKNLT